MKRFRLGGEEIEPESMNMASVLMLLSRGDGERDQESSGSAETSSPSRLFECKTCNRQFHSFQALGGHRASHKKPRLLTDGQSSPEGSAAKPKVHECSICGLEFAIGQALGGHMRRHRAATDGFGYAMVEKKPHDRRVFCFDLNLLPSENEIESRKMGFQSEIVY